jgi:hypothetical protein
MNAFWILVCPRVAIPTTIVGICYCFSVTHNSHQSTVLQQQKGRQCNNYFIIYVLLIYVHDICVAHRH